VQEDRRSRETTDLPLIRTLHASVAQWGRVQARASGGPENNASIGRCGNRNVSRLVLTLCSSAFLRRQPRRRVQQVLSHRRFERAFHTLD